MNQVSIELLANAILRTAGVTGDVTPAHRHQAGARVSSRHDAPELPDPAYWTDYDRYMIAREARARRHAHIIARVRAWANAVGNYVSRAATLYPASRPSALR